MEKQTKQKQNHHKTPEVVKKAEKSCHKIKKRLEKSN
jgi:hypothetical protein